MKIKGFGRRATPALAGIALLMLMSAAPALASRGHHGHRAPARDGERCGAPLAFLDLTEEQQQKIDAIRDAKAEQHVQIDKQLQRLDHAFEGEMMKDAPSLDELRSLAEQMGKLRTQKRILGIEAQLETRKLLTPEQRDRLLASPGPRGQRMRDGTGPRMPRPPAIDRD